MFHDTSPDEDIVRTIRLRDADLAAVSQLLTQLVGRHHGDQLMSAGGYDAPSSGCRQQALLRLARLTLTLRRNRTHIFGRAMFGEPAWDMLLLLYVALVDGPRLSVGRLTTLAGAPPTTALRWLDYLDKEKLVRRQENPTDRRSEFVEITDLGRTKLEAYLSETLETLA